MASSSSTNPLFEQVDRRITFQNRPGSLNTSNQMMAPNVFQTDIPKANFPMIPEARFTHHHQTPPVAVQDSFQPQNLQSHQKQFNPFHGDSLSEDNHSDQENWDVQDYANNDVQQCQWDPINFIDQENMAPNHQSVNHEFPLEPRRAPMDQQTPRNFVDHQMLHQHAPDAARDLVLQRKTINNEPSSDFMNLDNQFTDSHMSQKLGPEIAEDVPGSLFPRTTSGSSQFLQETFDPSNMVPVANHQISQPGMSNDLNPENVHSNYVKPQSQLMNYQGLGPTVFGAVEDQPGPLSGPSSFQGNPGNFINPQKLYQSTPNGNNATSSTDFMNLNNHFTSPQMPQQLIPGASSHQGTLSDFHSGQMNHNNMVPYQLTNQTPQQLALGLNQNYPSNWYAPAQQNMLASSTTPNPITFFLLNSENWQYLNSLTNEMMVTNDGRGIFPRFEIEIRNLKPMASYHVGIKLHLVSSKKFSYNVERYEWMEVDPRKSEELPEQETNEIHTPVQTGREIMEEGLKLKTVNIYSIGNEKKKRGATKGVMTEERVKKLERKKKIREETMMRVFPQRKYMPIFTLYRLTDFGIPEPVTTAQFPETEFITTTTYKNEAVKEWKTNNNPYVRPGYRSSKF